MLDFLVDHADGFEWTKPPKAVVEGIEVSGAFSKQEFFYLLNQVHRISPKNCMSVRQTAGAKLIGARKKFDAEGSVLWDGSRISVAGAKIPPCFSGASHRWGTAMAGGEPGQGRRGRSPCLGAGRRLT